MNQNERTKIINCFNDWVINRLNMKDGEKGAKLQLISDFNSEVINKAFPPKKSFIQRLTAE